MIQRWWQWRDEHIQALDVFTAVTLALLVWSPYRELSVEAVVSLGLVAPLAVRHRFPAASTAAVMLVAFAQWLLMAPGIRSLLPMPADVCIFIALYSVTVHGPRWAIRLAIAGALLGVVLETLVAGLGNLEAGAIVFALATLTVISTAAVGGLARARRQRLATLEERARLLELEQNQRTELALIQERNRIARDLHDIVAHSLAVVITQADGGRYAARADPGAAVAALTVVASTGRTAMADMRRLLGLLREDGAGQGSGSGTAPTAPQPGPGDLQALIDTVSASGVKATLVMNDGPAHVSEGLGLTVFRIVQEALTNVLRHAGPNATAEVAIMWEATAVEITIQDDGRGSLAEVHGHGLIGMRERAETFGGTVTTGPRSGGGFAVHARLYYDTTTQRL